MTRQIILDCDDDDFDAIQREFAIRQLRRRDGQTCLPDGESNLAGAMVAEMCRDLADYRDFLSSKP